MMHNLKLPPNPTLWGLHRLLDHASRWRDHASSREDFEVLDEFIYELEVKINTCTEMTQYLEHCFSIESHG